MGLRGTCGRVRGSLNCAAPNDSVWCDTYGWVLGMANEAQHPEIEHAEFLQRALTSAGEWTRHADPKALAVLALLGLGVKDLVDHAQRFVRPHEAKSATCDVINSAGHTCGGIAATG